MWVIFTGRISKKPSLCKYLSHRLQQKEQRLRAGVFFQGVPAFSRKMCGASAVDGPAGGWNRGDAAAGS
jgi:hypothetical protein